MAVGCFACVTWLLVALGVRTACVELFGFVCCVLYYWCGLFCWTVACDLVFCVWRAVWFVLVCVCVVGYWFWCLILGLV